MTSQQLLEKVKTRKIGKEPVVILPLDLYEALKEEIEMLTSKSFARKIEKARTEIKKGKLISLEEAKKKLGLM